MKKKIISSLLILCTCFTALPLPASASVSSFPETSTLNTTGNYTYVVPEDEVEKNLQQSLNEIVSQKLFSSKQARIPQYSKYDYVDKEIKYSPASGYAAGQPSYGTQFNTGGSFNWTDGGNNVSLSVGFSVGYASISVSLGSVAPSVTGYSCNVPSTSGYYKLFVKKTMKVKQVAVYGYPIGSSTREFICYAYPSSLYSLNLTAVRQ